MGELSIEHLYQKVSDIDERLVKLESIRPYLEKLLEDNVAANKALAETMTKVQMTMVQMNDKMDSMDKRITSIDSQVQSFQNESSFNIMGFLKKYFPYIVVAVGVAIFYVAQFVKF